MRKYCFPLCALVLGAAGFFVRRWQLAAAFEAESGLLTPGHPSTAWLVGLALFTVAAGLACGLSCRGYRTGRSLLNPGPVGVRAVLTLPAVGYLAAGVLTVISQLPLSTVSGATVLAAYLPLLLGLALAAGGGCMLLVIWTSAKGARERRKEGQTGRDAVTAMLPGFACCLMLVYYYHENANNPVAMEYMWMEFAMIAAMLAWYGFARLRFGAAGCVRLVWYSLLCIAFQVIPLAGERSLPCVLVLLANLVWFVVRLGQLLGSMEPREAE